MTDETRRGEHLDANMLAEYIDGGLEPRERADVETHLAECGECYQQLVESLELQKSIGDDALTSAPVKVARSRWVMAAGAFGLAAAAVLLLFVARPHWLFPLSADDASLGPLMAAVNASPQRALVPRLSAPFPWKDVPSVNRGSSDSAPVSPELTIAAAELERALQRDRTVPALRAFATAQLVLGHIERGIAALEEARQLQPDRVDISVDLSAAYYVHADAPEWAIDLPKGLEAANRAIADDATNAPAWFNKALILERLNIRDQARAAWTTFLTLDGTSGWADEARKHLAALGAPIAGVNTLDAQQPLESLTDTVLPQWAEATLHGDERGAAEAMRTATGLVESIRTTSNDAFAGDLVEALRGPRARQLSAARAHAAYGEARRKYRTDDFEGAERLFVSARAGFSAASSPGEHLTRLYEAIIKYRARRYDLAIHELRTLRQSVPTSYADITGRALWVEGLSLDLTGLARDATRCYLASIDALAAAGEPANRLFVQGLLASQFDRLGNPQQAWHVLHDSLQGSAREGTLVAAATLASRAGWHYASLDLETEAVTNARAARHESTLADALRAQASTLATLGQRPASQTALTEARTIVAARPGVAWDRLRAEIDVAEARIADQRSTQAGIDAATRALTYFQTAKAVERLPEVLLLRGNLRRQAQDLDGAAIDLRAGIDILSTIRSQLSAGTDQAAFGDTVRGLVDALVDLEAARGRPDEAFVAAENARGHDLPNAGRVVPLATLRDAMPAGTLLVDFVVSERVTYAWTIRQGRTAFVALNVDADTLSRLALASSRPRFDRAAAEELSRVLLGPMRDEIAQCAQLIIVPDGPLHVVPFAALPGVRERYLIEEHSLAFAPSVSAWLSASIRADAASSSSVRAVVAGNARLDRERFGNLPELRFAEEEAREIAGLYPGSRLLSGDAVTRSAIVDGLQADVLHFAGHAVINSSRPSESSLVVWDPTGPGLTAGAIRQLDAHRLSLIVLASCEGAAGAMTRSDGPLGLARAFLAAGATTVVASHWPADDRASLELFRGFHRAYRESGNAATALQRAQLELITSRDVALQSPGAWAGFVVFGGTPRSASTTGNSKGDD